MNIIKKILMDTLSNADDKFSRKSIMLFISFNTAILLILLDVISVRYNLHVSHDLIYALLGYCGFGVGASLYDKKKILKE